MKVTVIYPQGSLNDGNKPDPIRPKDTVMEIEVASTDFQRYLGDQDVDDHDILNTIWRMMNRLDGDVLERYIGFFQVRSMMVGDLVKISGKTYQAEIVGWSEVGEQPLFPPERWGDNPDGNPPYDNEE